MSGAPAVAVPTRKSALPADDLWREFAPTQWERDANDEESDTPLDETFADVKLRERREHTEVKVRARLDRPSSARGAYFARAIRDAELTHARFRVLCYHLDAGDPDLSNSFTSRKTAAAELGMELPTYDSHVAALRVDGYIRTQEFRKDDGTQSSSGIQFCLPGRVFFSGRTWHGPRRWDKRRSGAMKRNRKSRPAVND